MPHAASNTHATFQDVKQRADLADYIEQASGAKRKKVGSTVFFNPAPCCGHNDCFHLWESDTKYKCQSCGSCGDVFNYAEEIQSMDKGAALREVASWAGVSLPDLKKSANSPPQPENRLQRLLEAAIVHYQTVLAGRADVMHWLTAEKPDGRGHKAETLKRMEVGCADGRLVEALRAQGFDLDEVKASGLYVESRKNPGEWRDFFVPGLVIFPHRLPSGEVAHFTLKDPAKKLDYQFRSEHRLDGFVFGNQKAMRSDTVICLEGENDLASFFDAGYKNALASLGQLSDKQIAWLDAQGSGKTIITWFDYDTKWGDAGQPPAGNEVHPQGVSAAVAQYTLHGAGGQRPDGPRRRSGRLDTEGYEQRAAPHPVGDQEGDESADVGIARDACRRAQRCGRVPALFERDRIFRAPVAAAGAEPRRGDRGDAEAGFLARCGDVRR